jgi:UDP-3-O-[3-hydroxymyristoyl] glucosamine N-acyltransferase
MLVKGRNVKVFGPVEFGENVILEDGVVIGHPTALEVREVMKNKANFNCVDDFYSFASREVTRIGDLSIIRSGTVIYGGTTIGDRFDCGHFVLIREKVFIGSSAYIKSFTEVMKNVRIGDECRIAGTIADNTVIGNRVSSFGVLTHRYERHYTPEMSLEAGPTIEEGCIIGRGAVVIGGSVIHRNAIVGANAFVNFDVPEGAKVIGVKGRLK